MKKIAILFICFLVSLSTTSCSYSSNEEETNTSATIIETQSETINTIIETETVTIKPTENPIENKNIRLCDFNIFQGDGFGPSSIAEDNLGNEYIDALICNHWSSDVFNKYYLNKNYTEFIGTVFLLEEAKSTDREIPFQILGDDEVLFSCIITGGVLPQEFKLNVEGIEMLEIKASNVSSLSTMYTTYIGIGNAELLAEKKESIDDNNENENDIRDCRLIDYNVFQGDGFHLSSLVTDNCGNKIIDALINDHWSDEVFNKYYVNGKYKSLCS